jgi:hypothetical protein
MRSIRRLALVAYGAAALALGVGCAAASPHGSETWTMHASPKLPAAEGRVKVRLDSIGDHVVELAFQRLAPPGKAFAGATMYMVWIVPRNTQPQPVGSLDVDDALKARVSIKTPNENFDVLVTAEVSPYVTTPSANRAFTVAIRSAA